MYRLQGQTHAGQQQVLRSADRHNYASRYLLLCEAIESNPEHFAFTAFERLFKERGSRKRSARMTAFPLPRLTGCLISQKSQPGDYAWPSASNACIPVIPNRMAAMNACT